MPNPLIALMGKQINPLEIDAQVAHVQQEERQNRLANMMFGEKQREIADQSEVRNLLAGAGNDSKAAQSALMSKGYYKQANEISKAQLDQQKTQADIGKTNTETGVKRGELIGQTLGALMHVPGGATVDHLTRGLQHLVDVGGIDAEMAQKIIASAPKDPTQMRGFLQTGRDKVMGAKEQRQYTEADANTQATVANSASNAQLQARTSRANNADTIAAASTERKAPAGYRWSGDGASLEAIPGGPAGKAAVATEGERKAATLLKRLEGSQAQLNKALTDNPDAAKPGIVASGLRAFGQEAAANSMAVGSERQRVEAAQMDMLDAALTLGTGAAYTREQLEGYRKSYFPQIGDSDANVADKEVRLKNIIEAAKIAAGRAGPSASATPPAAPPTSKDGAVGKSKSGKPIVMRNGQWEYQ